jgi:hypothetical protein
MRRVSYMAPVPASQPVPPARVVLSCWQRMEVETARMLLMELPPRSAAELGPPRMAYLAGRLEGVAANLLDIVDAITTFGDET